MEIKILYLNIFILILSIYKIDCDEVKVPQIKVVGTQVTYLNPEYFTSNETSVVFTVRRVNATFNYLTKYWDLREDLPADIAVYLKVYATDNTYQGGNLILENVTPVCTTSKDRVLLPTTMHVPENLLNTQCMKKGVYQVEDLVQFRYEVLLPQIETMGSYYRAEYSFANEQITVATANFYSEWGYLHAI